MNIAISAGQKSIATKNKRALSGIKPHLVILRQSLLFKSCGPHLDTILSVSCTTSFNPKRPDVVGNFLAIFYVERKLLTQPCTNIYNAERYYSL